MQAIRRGSSWGRVDYTPGSAVSAGQVVVIGSLLGFAEVDIEANRLGALAIGGVFDVVKANEEITAGAAVYWDADGNPYGGTAGTGAATTTSSGNTFAGFALATAGATATTVRLVSFGPISVTNTVHSDLSKVIADPGNGGAIPVTDSGHVAIVTAGSETRTLAIPSWKGQELLLYIKTDGGTCVITVASAINQTGNNTITIADVRDSIRLQAIESGSNLVWDVVANNGAALSTV